MKLTGAQIVLECLLEQGVDTVFGYPGGAILNIYDELYKYSDKITHILTAHEQGASHAADGYARSTGKVGVVFATSGPGATNLVTGIATAYMDSIPVVAITCNVNTELLGKDSFQEVDIAGITMPITKHNFIVKDVKQLADVIRDAFIIAKIGRPGPVLIDIPKDITAATCEYEKFSLSEVHAELVADRKDKKPLRRIVKVPAPVEEKIVEVAPLINNAQKPVLYVGGGVIISDACKELLTLAETAQIPSALSLMGKAAFPNTHKLSLGFLGMHGSKAANLAVAKSDLLIAVGTRFSDRVTGDTKKFANKAKVIHIDIDPAEVNKNVHTTYSLIGNIKDTLSILNNLIEKNNHDAWLTQIDEWKKDVPPSWSDVSTLHPKFVFEYVNRKVPCDTIITTEVGQHQMWTAQFYNFEKPRTFLTSGGLGTMGYGTGAAIGAQVANPDKRVVHFAGDGSFRMNCNELATISHYNLPIVIIILNNGTLGMVRQWQNIFYKKHFSQTTLDFGPDFVKLADAYGIHGFHASSADEFSESFDKAFALKKPALIEVKIDIDEMVFPMIPAGKGVDNLIMAIDN